MDNEAFNSASKSEIRKHLRELLAAMTPEDRRTKSLAACNQIVISPEFQSAKTIMLFLSTPMEVDTTTLALRAWQQGKSVVVPKMSWDAKRMVPIEITSLSSDQLKTSEKGIREPISGNPVPLSFLDLIFVPGLGFTEEGMRIGRGMGFYDRFLAQPEFLGDSCGLCFEEQITPFIPMLDHDVPLSMLATDRGLRRVGKPHIAH